MKYIFGNWKMYLSHEESCRLATALTEMSYESSDIELCVFPTALSFLDVRRILEENTDIKVGAQNASWVEKGAYTGAISMQMFADVGAEYMLIGHSERRGIFNETDEAVHNKLQSCLDAGVTPVLCIGESLEEHESGAKSDRLKEQLRVALNGIETDEPLFIAYEPVWAIGSGNPADVIDVLEAVTCIQNELELLGISEYHILYGGSVDQTNVVTYLEQDAIDGVLIGGVSVKIDTMSALIETIHSA